MTAGTRHARERASQRFGLDLDGRKVAELSARVRARRGGAHEDGCVLLHRQNGKREHWAVWHAGEWIPLVYDTEGKVIVTVLPATALRRHKGKLPW